MITVTVHYGNHNKYRIDLPESTKLGFLSLYLTKLINCEPENVLGIYMCGGLVGAKDMPFTQTLAECNIIGGQCVASLILRDPDLIYPDADLYLVERNTKWLKQYVQTQQPVSAANLFQALGINTDGLLDVPVVIPEAEYERYITYLDSTPEDPCSICSDTFTDTDQVAQLACGHTFHDQCIRELLTTSSVKCPNCNYDVRVW